MVCKLASEPSFPGLNPLISIFFGRYFVIDKINCKCFCLESGHQMLYNANLTHLALPYAKLVLQNNIVGGLATRELSTLESVSS